MQSKPHHFPLSTVITNGKDQDGGEATFRNLAVFVLITFPYQNGQAPALALPVLASILG
jgi:hypothetical protein